MPDFDLDVGRLDKRVSIYNAPTGENVINEPTTAGTLLTKMWSELNPAGARDAIDTMRPGGDASEYTDVWRMRYNASIAEGMKLVWRSMSWRVVGLRILGPCVGLDVMAVRVV